MNFAHTPRSRERFNSRTNTWRAPDRHTAALPEPAQPQGSLQPLWGGRTPQALPAQGVPRAGQAPVASWRTDNSLLATILELIALRSTSYIAAEAMLLSLLPPPGSHHSPPARDAEIPGLKPASPGGDSQLRPGPASPGGDPELRPGPARTSWHRAAAARAARGEPRPQPSRAPPCPALTWPPCRPGEAGAACREGGITLGGAGTAPAVRLPGGCSAQLPHVAAQRPKWLRNSPPTPPPPQSLRRKHGVTASLPPRRSILPRLSPVPDPAEQSRSCSEPSPPSAPGSRGRSRCFPETEPSLSPGFQPLDGIVLTLFQHPSGGCSAEGRHGGCSLARSRAGVRSIFRKQPQLEKGAGAQAVTSPLLSAPHVHSPAGYQ